MRKLMLLAAVALISACGSGTTDFGTGVHPPPPPPPDSTGASFVTVSITDNVFTPASVTVPRNRAVRWTNNGGTAHTVTADDASFESNSIAPGGTFQRTFTVAGTFGYHCTIHPGMTGSVTVGP